MRSLRRILLLLPGAFTGVGGIEKYNRLLLRAASELALERGIEVESLLLNDWPEDVDGRYLHASASWPECFKRRQNRFALAAAASVASYKPDIVIFGHVHFARLAGWLRILAPAARHWYVVHGIEVWRELPGRLKKALQGSDRIFSVSEFTRDEMCRLNGVDPGKVVLQRNAVDPIWIEQYGLAAPVDAAPVRSQGRATILTVARLAASERYKGVDTVLRALPSVAQSVGDVVYEVVGDGDDQPRLEDLARQLNVSDRVIFRGRLEPRELAAAYRECDIFAMPSSKEGFGIVYLEAGFFGCPSLAGRHGGAPEAVEHGRTGLLVDREDVEGCAEALVRMLGDEAYRAGLGQAARKRVLEEFTFSQFRGSLESVLFSMSSAG